MTIPGALTLTATVLLFVAVAFAIAADVTGWRRNAARYSRLGWAAFALSIALFIAAIWTEVLT